MASSEETCEGNVNFAIICSFINKFGPDCGVEVTISALKEMLEDTKNVPEELKDLLIHLLRKGKKRVTKERWERALVKFCHEYSSVDAWEIERFGYKKAKLSVKLELLKRLLELQFDQNLKFKSEVNKQAATALRILPIGRDIDGHMYWYQLDKDCNMRLYLQEAENVDSWQLLCSTRDELEGVILSLGKKSDVKKDISKVLKVEENVSANDQVPMDEKPNIETEMKENVKVEHEDLTSSLSLTNPCAIIIKTEKKDSSCSPIPSKIVTFESDNAEKSNQSKKSMPSPEITVIEDRTLVKHECAAEEKSPQIKIISETEKTVLQKSLLIKTEDDESSRTSSKPEGVCSSDKTLIAKIDSNAKENCSKKDENVDQIQSIEQNSVSNSCVNNLKQEYPASESLKSSSITIHTSTDSPIEMPETQFKGSKMKLYEKWSNEKKKLVASNQTVPNSSKSPVSETYTDKSRLSTAKTDTPSGCETQVEPLDLALDTKPQVRYTSVISPVISKVSPNATNQPQDLSQPVICHTSASTCIDYSKTKESKIKPEEKSLYVDKKLKKSSEQLSPVDCTNTPSVDTNIRPFKKTQILTSESVCPKDTNEPSRHSVIFAVKNSKLVSPKLENLHSDHVITSSVISENLSCSKNVENLKAEESSLDENSASDPSQPNESVLPSKQEPILQSQKHKHPVTDYSVNSLIAVNKPKTELSKAELPREIQEKLEANQDASLITKKELISIESSNSADLTKSDDKLLNQQPDDKICHDKKIDSENISHNLHLKSVDKDNVIESKESKLDSISLDVKASDSIESIAKEVPKQISPNLSCKTATPNSISTLPDKDNLNSDITNSSSKNNCILELVAKEIIKEIPDNEKTNLKPLNEESSKIDCISETGIKNTNIDPKNILDTKVMEAESNCKAANEVETEIFENKEEKHGELKNRIIKNTEIELKRESSVENAEINNKEQIDAEHDKKKELSTNILVSSAIVEDKETLLDSGKNVPIIENNSSLSVEGNDIHMDKVLKESGKEKENSNVPTQSSDNGTSAVVSSDKQIASPVCHFSEQIHCDNSDNVQDPVQKKENLSSIFSEAAFSAAFSEKKRSVSSENTDSPNTTVETEMKETSSSHCGEKDPNVKSNKIIYDSSVTAEEEKISGEVTDKACIESVAKDDQSAFQEKTTLDKSLNSIVSEEADKLQEEILCKENTEEKSVPKEVSDQNSVLEPENTFSKPESDVISKEKTLKEQKALSPDVSIKTVTPELSAKEKSLLTPEILTEVTDKENSSNLVVVEENSSETNDTISLKDTKSEINKDESTFTDNTENEDSVQGSSVKEASLDQEMSDNPPDLTPNVSENKAKSIKSVKSDLKDNSESSDISNDIPVLDKQVNDGTSTEKKLQDKRESTKLSSLLPDLISDVVSTSEKMDCDKMEEESKDVTKSDDKEITKTPVKSRSKKASKSKASKKSIANDDCISKDFTSAELESNSCSKDEKKSPSLLEDDSLDMPVTRRTSGRTTRSRAQAESPDIIEIKPSDSKNDTKSNTPEPCEKEQTKITSFSLDFFGDTTETLDFKNPFNAIKNLEFHQKILSLSTNRERKYYEGKDAEEIINMQCELYSHYMNTPCCETKCSDYFGSNYTFKVKYYKMLGLELPVLKSDHSNFPLMETEVKETSVRQTRFRGRTEPRPPPRTAPIRKPKGIKGKKRSPAKSTAITKDPQDPDFIPESFIEILNTGKSKSKSTPASRGRQSEATTKSSIVPSSESESTNQSTPIKRSRRIQEQHQKKMSELAVEMQKEHRRLEQLAKKNITPNKKVNVKGKAAKVPVKNSKSSPKFKPPENEDTCLEAKGSRRKRKAVMNMAKLALMYDDDSKESEQSTSRSTEKSRRRRGARGNRKRTYKPWDLSSESETTVEEITEEEEEEEIEEPLVFTIDDDEFACEEIIEDEEPVVIRKARTAKKADLKEGEEEIVLDDKPCGKCGKHDKPEWILLCDNCDDGYHTSCLVPPLFTIPDGDWYCQPCEHLLLCECLSKELQKFDQLLKQKEREELRKQRLAYVGISLDNVLKPEKEKKEESEVESSTEESSEKEYKKERKEKKVRHHKVSSEDEFQKSIYSKRSSRCRQRVNYQFKEYDELIASAIQDDLFDIKIAEEFVPPEKEEKTDDDDDESYTGPKSTRPSRQRRKPRRLNDLDYSDEDDSGDDYKGLSTDTEHTPSVNTEVSMSGSNASGEWRIVKTKKKTRSTRSRRKRRNKYSSSEDEVSESDGSNYRPTTRRAAQKAISYREISSEDEWEEFPKKSTKRKKKDTSSEASEASDDSTKSPKAKRVPKPNKKWDDSTSESESSESAESSSTRQSTSEWKIEKKSSEGGRIKININKRQIESDSNSSSKETRVTKKVNRIVSDDSDEDEETNEDEETDEEGESSDSSEKSDDDDELSKKSDEEKTSAVKAKIPSVNVKPAAAKPVIKPKPAEFKSNLTSNSVKPSPKVVSQERTPGGNKVKVGALPNVMGISKNVTVCHAVALNREKVASNQIVVKTVVVKTVPKGSIKEIKMVPSKIPYKDKIDSSETETKKSTVASREIPKSPMPNSPAPNSPTVKGPNKTPIQQVKVGATNLQLSPKNTPQHKSVISNASSAVKQFPAVEQQRFNPSQHAPFQHGMPDIIRGHPMQNIIGPNGQLPPQRFPNPLMEQHSRGNPMIIRNVGPPPSQRFVMDAQMRPHPSIQMPVNRSPHPNMPVGVPPRNYSSPILEHQASMQQTLKCTPVQQAQSYSGSIIEPFNAAEIDQGSDSRDEVPLERIPSASNSPPVELIPTKAMPETEYLPAKDANYPYTIPEEKGFPPSYSPLSSLQEFTSRPSPLKPSLVESYPSNSASPTRLTSLDNYSQANSPKGFISLDSFPRKKAPFSGSPSESGMMQRHPSDYQGEARFPQEPYPCQSSPGSYQQRASTPQQQKDVGTPPRLYSQFPDSYAPPRSPEFYQNQQQYYGMEEGGTQRSNYQPNYTPSDNSSYNYVPNAIQQPNNDGFMIDTILRARNEEDELGNVSGIVQYITQQ